MREGVWRGERRGEMEMERDNGEGREREWRRKRERDYIRSIYNGEIERESGGESIILGPSILSFTSSFSQSSSNQTTPDQAKRSKFLSLLP